MNGGYICQPCDKIFNGEAPYKDHILSEKHQRKINSSKLGASLQTIENYKDLNLDEHIQKYGIEFKCVLCNVCMNDITMAASHVKGQKHLKTISRLGSLGSISVPGMELDSNIKKCGTEYICKTCNVFMNDVSIVSSHLKGQKHLKALSKMSPSLSEVASLNLDNSFDSVSSVSDLVANPPEGSELKNELDRFIEKKDAEYVCNACNIVMDDLSVAMNHARGSVHLKSIALMDSSVGYKENVDIFNKTSLKSSSSTSTPDMNVDRSNLKRGLDDYIEKKGLEYVCNACHVSMNDISIVSSHLRGQKHLKTLSRMSNSDLVNESLNCVDLNGKLDQTIVKKGLMYVCNACDATMNDISTATSHAKGQKHLKNISKLKYSDGDILLQSPDPNISDLSTSSAKRVCNKEYKLDQYIVRWGTDYYKCTECDVLMNDISTAETHVRGQKHIKSIAALKGSGDPKSDNGAEMNTSESSLSSNESDQSLNGNMSVGSPDQVFNDSCIEKLGNDYLCRSCNVFMNSDSTVRSHLHGQKHLKNKLHYKKDPTNITDDGKSTRSIDTDDMYLFNKKFSLNVHTVDEVLSDVKVFKKDDPVAF